MKRIPLVAAVIVGITAFVAVEHAFTNERNSEAKPIARGECRCIPTLPCWPTDGDWEQLSQQLEGSLVKPKASITACQENAVSDDCKAALKTLSNPFSIAANPGDTQSQGWMGAWMNTPSSYAVEAESAEDVSKSIKFAVKHNLRVMIKGAAHDYLGRNTAPNSLLIWTHKMRDREYTKSFVPEGCPMEMKAFPAITVGAGTRWLEAYDLATNKHNEYVQGGGCTTVGVAGGFTQGGGFGQFSKQYGTGAASVAEVEVVTASGRIIKANECQNSDLFWAIRGGGGGTFGVVTKMTLKTHPLPKTMGLMEGTIHAKNEADYKKLVSKFLGFYRDNLNNPNWGEQIKFDADNNVKIFMMYINISKEEALNTFKPMQEFVNAYQGSYEMKLDAHAITANKLWDMRYMKKNYPELITINNAKKKQFWWTPNSGEVSAYWYTYQSWWLPINLFKGKSVDKLADTIVKASRLATVALHVNKGLSGASKEAIEAGKKTSTHPGVYNAAALVIMNARTNKHFVGVKNKEPNQVEGKDKVANINEAMQMFRELAPNAGSYANEADFFMQDWQKAFWGTNYRRLLKVKRKYDRRGLFICHHCVGSEKWSDNGMCRV